MTTKNVNIRLRIDMNNIVEHFSYWNFHYYELLSCHGGEYKY
jgi:hypothetical protein